MIPAHPGAAQCAHITLLCPLGLSSKIPSGLKTVREEDWWDRVELGSDSLALSFLPSQHWHKRLFFFDIDCVFWGGWMLQSNTHTIYHIGDSGYYGGFEAASRVFPRLMWRYCPSEPMNRAGLCVLII
ncbi:MBL fold metallo-hydrolase [Bradymonas sediminis]